MRHTDDTGSLEKLQLRKDVSATPPRQWRITLWLAAIIQSFAILTLLYHQELLPTSMSLIHSLDHKFQAPWPKSNEAFEFRLPVVHPNLVHEQQLIEYTFSNSWGRPAIASFNPPLNKEFNRVILELNTTVDGVQYDRLAHVFINDIPVWRTSTAEPGNDLVFYHIDKDVSKYLSLFKSPVANVTLQLDNLVRGKLTGAFNTTLTAKYYNIPEKPNSWFHYFTTTSKPAERVTQLINPKPNRTPLSYYPSDKLELSIPKISHNTTSLKLALYISGNAQEEFWYTNVIESRKHQFKDHGHVLSGHGPVRVVNTYLNNILVSVDAPEPVIFTGGISPALWRPIVGVNAFDLKPIEIDLTPFLPELWKNSVALDIEITNGTNGGTVGSNWITAANLLSWESDEIANAFGEIEDYTNSSTYHTVDITTDPDKYFQVVQSRQFAELTSNLTYVLKNGTELPLIVHSTSNAKFSNNQQYYLYGDAQFLASTISSTHTSSIKLDDEEANVTNVYGSTITLGGKEVLVVESRQNGTSVFTLSPKGNHGNGTTEHIFAAELYPPFPNFKEDAFARAVNGKLVEFDQKYKVSDPEETLMDIHEGEVSLFGFESITEHLHDIVSDGQLSAESAKDFIYQAKQMKDSVERSVDEVILMEGEVYQANFPGFRPQLE
ncbi:Peptide-N4-(N-acetyl-beta-glucosaminyl)asparagine amidase A [Cyberlindnera fabianii]|uniref:Peptide-N4-(N-acetyl-beta-glucosaminyl)asparagine amidase A n=1 Tax=Cyberlindnera fabianii TaxID=36022 RepID=A0A1V2L6E8_CYBFA|nr:Peptide-N4-(N-acetyl-beta-glucosaminyl)asparagine amidase A [Cyberlindnera fabianii]